MTKKLKDLYEKAKKDKEFLADIKRADNDEMPSFYASDEVKGIFIGIYYGWRVGKYGADNWDIK